ncbi:MAG TPA: helix-turn-helix transcriptional regulator [Polaromonas sp.]|uniref:helix-turn-helix transcriptional regulator n=1 Tax=Polaromonas sp. TaxID=1869339 RepID=UPI002D4BBC8A|nr:helix-turn-helix transcriptional regulator [Polaromonas sp.]HYW56278.1 helix-turn-helix transcriptional regulator [Polaromonas sp.]
MNTLLNPGFADSALPLGAAHLDAGVDVLASLMDVLAHGAVVVNQGGHIFHVNQAARSELNRQRVLCKIKGEIEAVHPAESRTLQTALDKAAKGKRSLINIKGDGHSLTVAVVPLKREAGAWDSRIALLFARAEVCESGMVGFFARTHGLTHTEEQVLIILCRGLSAPEIAVHMKVAVSTVRSHVRSLCAKTGTSGVRELVNRVAVLPPVAPLHLVQIH